MAAAQMGLTGALNKLIDYGCDIGQVDNNQHDTLCYALVETTENHLECLRTCLDQEEKYYKDTMSILLAIEKGEEGLIYAKEILDNLSNPNIFNSVNRRSALSYACEHK